MATDPLSYAGLASTLGGLFLGAIGLAYGLHNKVNEAALKGLQADIARTHAEVTRIDGALKEHEARSASKEALNQLREDLKGAIGEVKAQIGGMANTFASKESVEHVAQGLADVKSMMRDLHSEFGKVSAGLLEAIRSQGRGA